MTEHDGLTAEQEAGRVWSTKRDQIIFVRGAEWATEREKTRAEAAEARVAELESALMGALALIEHANRDAFKNGVTDSTGSIDEGDVMAGEIVAEIRRALAAPEV